MMATRDEMLLELNHWRDRYGPPRWQNRAMHDLIGEIIAVVGDGPSGPRVAEPAGMWEKVTAAHLRAGGKIMKRWDESESGWAENPCGNYDPVGWAGTRDAPTPEFEVEDYRLAPIAGA